eukprot:TRINITY_DN4584_c0_g1_i1.p1 TRINITY_DN4584_c0_g1~~TRINITY_DN4584_c0_g1_i1.p1  ORF type:complete len:364 (-),score=57.21 TRINITY_DN4584_c0_g1_i1:388-1437(-)
MTEILSLRAYDATKIIPQDYDFLPLEDDAGKEPKTKKAKDDEDNGGKEPKAKKAKDDDDSAKEPKPKKQKLHLPRRVNFKNFSRVVGWRPFGVSKGQLSLLLSRLPTDLRRSGMSKVVLPCSLDGKPFVTEDGRLPNPNLALFEACRLLEDKMDEMQELAREELKCIAKDGIQVEWKAFKSFAEWAAYMEAGHMAVDLTMRVHVVETAANYLSWRQSGSSDSDEGFVNMYGRQVGPRRLAEAKTYASSVGVEATRAIVQFRRKHHAVVANLFREDYVLNAEFRKLPHDLQKGIVDCALEKIAGTPINWKAQPPKPQRLVFTNTDMHNMVTASKKSAKKKVPLEETDGFE